MVRSRCSCGVGGGLVTESSPTLVAPWTVACRAPPWDSPGQNTGVGCHFLLQGTFPTQESNPGPLNYRQVLYLWSYEGNPNVAVNLPTNQMLLSVLTRKHQVPGTTLYFWGPGPGQEEGVLGG